MIIFMLVNNGNFFLFHNHSFGFLVPEHLPLHLLLGVIHIWQVVVIADVDYSLDWLVLVIVTVEALS
jgi:hypothetical protein